MRGPRGARAASGLLALVLALCAAGVSTVSGQERPLVVIDPGHGGAEAGVVDGDLVEKDLVLRIGFQLADELVSRGYDVRLTRSGDSAVPWDDRRGLADEQGASALFMLHINGSEDRTRHGAEIYVDVSNARSSGFADEVERSLAETGAPVVVEGRNFPFLQSPTVATVMIELAFMTHPVERRIVASPAYHRELANRLADAADRFLGR